MFYITYGILLVNKYVFNILKVPKAMTEFGVTFIPAKFYRKFF